MQIHNLNRTNSKAEWGRKRAAGEYKFAICTFQFSLCTLLISRCLDLLNLIAQPMLQNIFQDGLIAVERFNRVARFR